LYWRLPPSEPQLAHKAIQGFEDAGVSGAQEKRPGLDAALKAWQQAEIF
jgi:hypothetical protein